MNKKQRDANRRNAEALRRPVYRRCSNCGQLTHYGHFAPPSFGMPGQFIWPWEPGTHPS